MIFYECSSFSYDSLDKLPSTTILAYPVSPLSGSCLVSFRFGLLDGATRGSAVRLGRQGEDGTHGEVGNGMTTYGSYHP